LWLDAEMFLTGRAAPDHEDFDLVVAPFLSRLVADRSTRFSEAFMAAFLRDSGSELIWSRIRVDGCNHSSILFDVPNEIV
jgi:hypothetical protein